MASHTWMNHTVSGPRARVRRSRGRRASDRAFRVEGILAAIGVIAWAWCAYELIRAFVH